MSSSNISTACPPEAPLPSDLALLSEVVHHAARRHRLSPADVDDFVQDTLLRVISGEWKVFEKFDRRSSLRTYLTAAVKNQLLDRRNRLFGRWRASAAAARLGPTALTLERLIYRDGLSAGEAIALVHAATGESETALAHLVDQVPPRVRRHVVTSHDLLLSIEARDTGDPLLAREESRRARAIRMRLARALADVPPDVRWLLTERYARDRTVRSIAQSRATSPKRLYTQYERVLGRLRRRLEAEGVTGPDSLRPAANSLRQWRLESAASDPAA
jgi:RNA polymerase sigma factor (sigma-70 family)